jgi:hypothetical protein
MTKLEKSSLNNEIKDIKTPSPVVHIKHSITLRQYKLWVVLLQCYQDAFSEKMQQNEDGFFSISREKINEYMGYEYGKEPMRRDLEAIRKEPIILNYIEKGGNPVTHGMGFISEWKVASKTVYFKIPSFLEKVMQGLEQPKAMFQLINWQIFDHFSGKYEAVIYKLCRDYVGIGRTPYMTIAEFRQYMGLKDGEHVEFKALNRRVIDAPIARINESTLSDISVEAEYVRDEQDGRKTKGLIFHVSKKHQQQLPFMEFVENPAFKFAKTTIKTSDQTQYLATRTPEEIALCIERANQYGEQLISKGKTAEYGAIYRKAITEGWHEQYAEQKALQTKIEQDKKTVQAKATQTKAAEDQATAEKLELRKRLLSEFEAMPENEKKRLTELICAKSKTVKTDYIRHGVDGAMFRTNLVIQLKKERGIA